MLLRVAHEIVRKSDDKKLIGLAKERIKKHDDWKLKQKEFRRKEHIANLEWGFRKKHRKK